MGPPREVIDEGFLCRVERFLPVVQDNIVTGLKKLNSGRFFMHTRAGAVGVPDE